MLTTLITILVLVLIGAVLYWAAGRVMGALGVPDPFRTIVLVIIVLIILVAILERTGLVTL